MLKYVIVTVNGNGNEEALIRPKVLMLEKKRVTIREVAIQAGVSTQTVSRVINNRPDVADKTRLLVQQVIDDLSYYPDPNARSLKGKSHTLGCISPGLADPIFSIIVEYAQAEARSQGYFFLIGSAETTEEAELLLTEMLNRRVEGVLVINPRDDKRYLMIRKLIDNQIPVVYLKNSPGDDQVSSVRLNDFDGGKIATQYLIDHGHTRIATILGRSNEESVGDRLSGYQEALRAAGIDPDEHLVFQGDWSPESGSRSVKSLIQTGLPFTAVFAQNDRMAVGAIQELRKAGCRVPEDVSVIGYDDIPLASFFDPPLTTIKQPLDQFGVIGAQLLIETVANHNFRPNTVVLSPEIIERNTCKAI